MKKIIFILLITLLASCAQDEGHKITGGNLTVHFEDANDQALATEIAHFWKDNDLIASQPHDIKLSKHKDGYRLGLIAGNKEDAKNMIFKERKALQDLQNMLKDSIFQTKTIEIIITDDRFKPIFNINE